MTYYATSRLGTVRRFRVWQVVWILALLSASSRTIHAQLPTTLQLQVHVKGDAIQPTTSMQQVQLFHDAGGWGITLAGWLPSQVCTLTSSERSVVLDVYRNILQLATMAGLGVKVFLGCIDVERPTGTQPARVNLDEQKPGSPIFTMALRG
jgi:hypothetical protein